MLVNKLNASYKNGEEKISELKRIQEDLAHTKDLIVYF